VRSEFKNHEPTWSPKITGYRPVFALELARAGAVALSESSVGFVRGLNRSPNRWRTVTPVLGSINFSLESFLPAFRSSVSPRAIRAAVLPSHWTRHQNPLRL
jgi:hypothetical protein